MSTQNERPSYPFTASNGVVVTVEMARQEPSTISDLKTLQAVNEAIKKCGAPKRDTENGLAVSEKGAVSLYGVSGRFPITLYPEAWIKVLGRAAEILAFIEKHRNGGKLKFKAPKA